MIDPASPVTLGQKIDLMKHNKNQQQRLKVQLKEFEEEYRIMEQEVMEELEAHDLTGAPGHIAKVTLKEALVPTVSNRDQFYQFIIDNNALHFLVGNPAILACREAATAGETPPGITMFCKKSLTLSGL